MKSGRKETLCEDRPPRDDWPPLQEIGLRVLERAGFGPQEIAARLPGPKRSPSAVRIKLCRLRKRLGPAPRRAKIQPEDAGG